MADTGIAYPIFYLFLHGQKITREQAINLQRKLIELLLSVDPPFLAADDVPQVRMEVVSKSSDETEWGSPNQRIASPLCIWPLGGQRISRSQAMRLRLALIEFLLESDPQLLSGEEVSRTYLHIIHENLPDDNHRKGEWGGSGCLVVLPKKRAPINKKTKGIITVGPTELDSRLKNLAGYRRKTNIVRDFSVKAINSGLCRFFLVPRGMEPAEFPSVGDLGVLPFGSESTAASQKTNQRRKSGIGEFGLNFKEFVNLLLYDGEPSERYKPEKGLADSGLEEELALPEDLEPPSINRLKKFLSSRVIGQERAIREIARAFNLAKAGLLPKEQPLLVNFWAGPTSVGKTEMAYALADFLWEMEKEALERARLGGEILPFSEEDIAERPLVEVDCGMFSGEQTHGIANLIGSPAGYVGSKGTGQNAQPPILGTRNFPKNRITVLLFDEVEKAYIRSRDEGAALTGILMKILDKGRFRNNWGEVVDFSKTIIIFTSNIGSEEIERESKGATIGFGAEMTKHKHLSEKDIEHLNDKIYESTKKIYEEIFKPELRNRIHRFIVFRFLTDENYRLIIQKEFKELVRDPVRAMFNVDVVLSASAAEWILSEIRREEGIRKLRGFMLKEIVEPLARAYNLSRLKRGQTYEVRLKQVPAPTGRKGSSGKNGSLETKVYFAVKKTENP